MVDTELRDYQREMLSRLESSWRRHRSVLVQMPTGTGKTHLMAEVVRCSLPAVGDAGASCRVLIVAHRRELISQITGTLSRFGLDGAGPQIAVESIQRLSRHALLSAPGPGLVIVDEAHHALARTYRMLWDRWPSARFLGLTATPCRLSGEPFTGLFDVLLQSSPIQWFIDRGWLSDFEYVSASPYSQAVRRIAALRKRGADGDYQQKEMAMVLDNEESVGHLYETYRAFCLGKKGIVYAISQEHAKHIVAYYRAQGVRCAVIDSKTPAKERERLVAMYRDTPPHEGAGTADGLDVLVNVDIFGEGFDCPEVEFIQLARPTLSLSKYLQQVGRGMRVSEGKKMATVLDNAGLYLNFGFPTDGRDWRGTFLGMKAMTGRNNGTIEKAFRGQVTAQDEKACLNLEMVRIKHGGERKSGLEVFEEKGKYGVKYDGEVTCVARFDRIEPLRDSEYFAIATYRPVRHGHAGGYRKTVIDCCGHDLHSEIMTEGALEDMGNGFFMGMAGSAKTYWDVKTGRAYLDLPSVERFGYIEGLYAGDDCYALRTCHKEYEADFIFKKEEVYYSRFLTIIRDRLIVNNRPTTTYGIYGYRRNQIIIIKSDWPREYQLVNLDGTFGKRMQSLGAACIQMVSLGAMFLGKQRQ